MQFRRQLLRWNFHADSVLSHQTFSDGVSMALLRHITNSHIHKINFTSRISTKHFNAWFCIINHTSCLQPYEPTFLIKHLD